MADMSDDSSNINLELCEQDASDTTQKYNWHGDNRMIEFPFSKCRVKDHLLYPLADLWEGVALFRRHTSTLLEMIKNGSFPIEENSSFLDWSSGFCMFTNPVDVFLSMGIDVIGSPSYEYILKAERIKLRHSASPLQKSTRKLMAVVHNMTTTSNTSQLKNYLGNLINAMHQYHNIYLTKDDGNNGECSSRITRQMKELFEDFKQDGVMDSCLEAPLFQWIYHCMCRCTCRNENGEVELDTDNLNEKFLEETIYRLLTIEGDLVFRGTRLNVPQFRHESDDSQECRPSMQFCGKIGRDVMEKGSVVSTINAVPVKIKNDIEVVEDDDGPSEGTTGMNVTQLRQVWEQLVDAVCNYKTVTEEDIQEKRIVCQSEVFVNNNKAQIILLVLDVDLYLKFSKFRQVEDTVKFFSECGQANRMWCRLYVNFELVDTNKILHECRRAHSLCGFF